MPLSGGTRLGPYEITAPIGAGGMGEVYKARDTRLNRTVAIKVLPADLASGAEERQRFEREARIISQLNHPHICVLHDVGHQDGIDYLVMELLDGETLAAHLSRGALAPDRALAIAIAICDALDCAHQQGIVHRDVKPGNILLSRAGVKLLDFGLARPGGPLTPDSADTIIAAPGGSSPPLTTRGSIVGTVQYMAPEQIEGRPADARCDIWAVGCVLYEMLAGTPAFSGASPANVIASILEKEPPPLPPARTGVTPSLERVLRTCLEKAPADRWQSARDLLRELRWTADDSRTVAGSGARSGVSPIRRRRRWVLVAGVALAVVTAIVSATWTTRSRGAPASPGPPVVVLMDSTHPMRVYDDETRRAGGTNADDLTDLLRDLPVILLKENTGLNWHREDEVLRQKPDLVLVHRSCFFDQTFFDSDEQSMRLAPLAWDKLEMFIGYAGLAHPRTKFLVYSRRSWETSEAARAWVQSVEGRFPALRGRVRAWRVPLDHPTFRHPVTGAAFKRDVVALLGLAEEGSGQR